MSDLKPCCCGQKKISGPLAHNDYVHELPGPDQFCGPMDKHTIRNQQGEIVRLTEELRRRPTGLSEAVKVYQVALGKIDKMRWDSNGASDSRNFLEACMVASKAMEDALPFLSSPTEQKEAGCETPERRKLLAEYEEAHEDCDYDRTNQFRSHAKKCQEAWLALKAYDNAPPTSQRDV